MSDKIARLGIERDNDLMYYIKNGDVWASPRKQKGQPKGKAKKVAETGLELDYSKYLYFLDGDGDVARKERALGGRAKAKAPSTTTTKKTPRSSITGHYVTEATVKRHPRTTVKETVKVGRDRGKKSEAQLDREIEECLAKVKGSGYTVSDAPVARAMDNGKPAVAKKRGGMKKKRR